MVKKVGDYLIRNNYFSVLLICQHSLLRSSFTMFICDYCGKSFLLKHVLNTHMKIHDDNECMCDVCEKICKNKVALKDHKKIHSNPVECNLCQKKFLKQVNLNKYLRSHDSGDKKECPVCKIEISTNNFKRHEISCLKKELKIGEKDRLNYLGERQKNRRSLPELNECELCNKQLKS